MKSLFFRWAMAFGLAFMGSAYAQDADKKLKLVPLSQILENRAAREELVPDYAANDEDFIRFITAIRSRVPNTGILRPLARVFESEVQTSGVNAYEMYTRIKSIVSSLSADIETLNAALAEKQAGRGYSTRLLCVNAQICVAIGLRFGIGIGFEKRGSWYLPIISVKGQGTAFSNGGGAFIANADVGFEERKSLETPALMNHKNEDVGGGALVLGAMLTGKENNSISYRSLAVGIGLTDSEATGYEFKLPVFFPIPVRDPVAKAVRLQNELANALQHFDLARAATLTAQFRNQISIVKAEYKARTGGDLGRVPLEDGHPFYSTGLLFSGSSLVLHSPNLVPDLIELYGVHSKKRKGKCETPIAIDVESSRVEVAGSQTKALRE